MLNKKCSYCGTEIRNHVIETIVMITVYITTLGLGITILELIRG